MSGPALWVMTCEAVYESHGNHNRTHEAVHELMNNKSITCLCNKSSCNWFVHGVKLMLQSNVQIWAFANCSHVWENFFAYLCIH